MEPEKNEGDPKRLSEGIVEYMRKRSKHEVPRFTVQLKKFIKVREKRTRAAISRRNSEVRRELRAAAGPGKRGGGGCGNLNAGHDVDPTDKAVRENRDEEEDERATRSYKVRSRGRSRSGAQPRDACGKKRCCPCPQRRRRPKKRRRSSRRKRKGSCRPKRRRSRRRRSRRRRSRRRRSRRRRSRRRRSRRRRSCRRKRR